MDSKERMSQDFAHCYNEMCGALGMSPLSCVTAYAKNRTLSINADKIGAGDWPPLLNALKINEALEAVIIQSYAKAQVSESSRNGRKRFPAIRSDELVTRLCMSIKDCLGINGRIKVLSLIGLCLKDVDIRILSKGLQRNKSLTQLSFENSLNGAKHFEDILKVLKANMMISCVNFSGCCVNASFAHLLADYIRHQMSIRHDQVWQDGLRYRRPALDSMGGLRRITINDNPHFGDRGVDILCSVIREDIWIKALDIQNCNITNEGGEKLLRMLELNASLVVVDARQNLALDSEILQKIRHQCRINWGSQETEFKWLSVNESERKNVLTSKCHTKPTKSSSTPTRSVASPHRSASLKGDGNRSCIPWRTASRANRVRNVSPEKNYVSTPSSMNNQGLKSSKTSHCEENDFDKDSEIQSLREQVTRLTEENNHLKCKCRELERKQIETEETLDVIENSFAKFHGFLDLLRQIGLGHLVTLAKLNGESENPTSRGAGGTEFLVNQSVHKPTCASTHLDSTDQLMSFLEKKINSSKLLSSISIDQETVEQITNTPKFQELVDQALKNGEDMVRMSSLASEKTAKDLADNKSGGCIEANENFIANGSLGTSDNFENDLMIQGPKEFTKDGRISRLGEFIKTREKLKAIENSEYSLNFDSMSSGTSIPEDVSGFDHAFVSPRGIEDVEMQAEQSFVPSSYLKANKGEEDTFSISGNDDLLSCSISSRND